MYYHQSSELTAKNKMKDALYNLFIWTLIPAILCILIWVYLFFTKRVTFAETPQLVISLTNA